MRRFFLVLAFAVIAISDLRAESVLGKVKAISVEKRQMILTETGIGEKDSVMPVGVNPDAVIEEIVGGKRVPLRRGLADIQPGDDVGVEGTRASITCFDTGPIRGRNDRSRGAEADQREGP
jgi:hypothetical protein